MPIQKQKLLILQQILLAETDEDHGLTLSSWPRSWPGGG